MNRANRARIARKRAQRLGLRLSQRGSVFYPPRGPRSRPATPNWWLCVHPWDSNDLEERGNFPTRAAAQEHAQDREDRVLIQAQQR
jgi:hypothetical protein